MRDTDPMSRRPDESAAQWYERAIVAKSISAAELEKIGEAGGVTSVARHAITTRAESAEVDLISALDAYVAERRASMDSI